MKCKWCDTELEVGGNAVQALSGNVIHHAELCIGRLAARLAEAEATLREMREALDVIATYEGGYLINASEKQREIARAALERARERLGAK